MGWVRLNTDGSCRDNGHIGCGDKTLLEEAMVNE
jgi:hypothetical protein